ncbi:hypothetical protein KW791_01490 [Candidatus Parcubacteria bacterium]|nr:hypothetical protein [Candidatus Parcubacteria bacterium]
MKKIVIVISGLAVSVSMLLSPFLVQAIPFGGRIQTSEYRVCELYIGIATIPVPLQVIQVGQPKSARVVFIYYLAFFGTIYQWYRIYNSGPWALGTYIPIPIPWVDCSDLYPTNLILKVGTSRE